MRWAVVAAVAIACGAHVDSDHAIDAALGSDAPPQPCTGGDAHATAPDGSCLMWFAGPKIWVDARTACIAMGAHLAYLKSAALDDVAEPLVGSANTFIGGDDRATEGTFVWDDGSPFVFTNWGSGEPNNGGSASTYQEDCVIIAGARATKKWDDRPCDATEVTTSGNFAYLCQK